MKKQAIKILIEQGLWETLLNDDRFLEHLRECDKSDNWIFLL